jgi:NAD(P)H-hydrate epimerase
MISKNNPVADRRALLTPLEMNAADCQAVAGGIDGASLMEAAGRAVAEAVLARWAPQPVSILCGPGNNGGDGFVVARHLAAAGWTVRVGLLGERDALLGDAAHHAALWDGMVEALTPDLLDGAGIVIDAIFGAGLSRPVEGIAAQVIEAVIHRRLPVCAIDVPSGLDGATGSVLGIAAPAELTVTFFRKKPGHVLLPGRSLCGELIVADIGISDEVLAVLRPSLHENGPELWVPRYPFPALDGHKFQRGEVLLLGGETMTGAGRLSAHAALRAGAGLVTLAAPKPAWEVYAAALTCVIVRRIDGAVEFDALLADQRRNAIAIGPGAGAGATTRHCVASALATRRMVVLDADALTSFADEPELLFGAIHGPCVLTPHEGEFARLFATKGDKLARARRAAETSNAVVLLKGADTVIAAPDGRTVINTNAPPELATAGSGDVLTGIIAGLAAQGMDAFDAACAGAWLHGEAGTAVGLGLIASDLADALPPILKRLKIMQAAK